VSGTDAASVIGTGTGMTDRGPLPPKLYFRIGEVAHLVGVEPHVLRYWEREFRSIRPSKSAKGQRVYSRRDVESLLRVRELLYGQGFTIAGARRKLRDKDGNEVLALGEGPASASALGSAPAVPDTEPQASVHASVQPTAQVSASGTPMASMSPLRVERRTMPSKVRGELESLRAEIESLLNEIGGAP